MENKIPKTKREAFAQLDEMLSEEDKIAIMNGDSFEFHFSLGMWIRNNWIYEQEETDVKHLVELFSKYPQKWNPKTGKCPKCGEYMKATGVQMFVD